MNTNNPQKEWKIPLYKIYSDDEDIRIITKLIKRGTHWAIGPEIEEFENLIKNYVGCDYCVTLNSGTSALHSSFLAYNLGHGDEIIVPSFSFIANVNSVLFVDGAPKFCDIENSTYGLDPEFLLKIISDKTKAIVPMDYGGLSCNILKIKDIAKENNLTLIQDSAEALGATINNQKLGTIADSTIFSFCGNKVLTTGEGGAVVTNSKDIWEKIRMIRSHGRLDKINYFENPSNSNYEGLGYNWRISSFCAAIGISQIQKLDKLIKLRRENANYISTRINKHKEITIPIPPKNHEHTYQMFSILLDNKIIRNQLHEFLIKKRIFSKVYFYPIHLFPFYRKKFGTTPGMLPITEDISERILTLPLYPNMTLEEKNYLIDSIDEFFEKSANN